MTDFKRTSKAPPRNVQRIKCQFFLRCPILPPHTFINQSNLKWWCHSNRIIDPKRSFAHVFKFPLTCSTFFQLIISWSTRTRPEMASFWRLIDPINLSLPDAITTVLDCVSNLCFCHTSNYIFMRFSAAEVQLADIILTDAPVNNKLCHFIHSYIAVLFVLINC